MADIKNLNNTSVRFESGSNAAPGIAFIGDPNTGIFQSAADTLQIAVGGGQKVRVDTNGVGVSAGNVYIASGQFMHFDFGVTNNYYIQKSSTDLRMYSAGSLSLRTNGSTRLHVNSSGNVGIGTTSPARELHVSGNIELSGAIYGENTDHTYLEIGNSGYSHRFYTRTNVGSSLERFQIEGGAVEGKAYFLNTNVGIGTTNPQQKLVIANATNGQGLEFIPGTTSTIQSYDRTGGAYKGLNIDIAGLHVRTNATDSAIYVKSSNSFVGLGNDAPTQRLTVQGNISASGNLYIDGTTNIDGDLTVGGIVTAQEFHTEFVSASIIFKSGSTQFGNDSNDTHIFSGSLTQHTSPTRYINLKGGYGDLQVVSDNNTTPVAYIKGTGTADLLNVFDNTTEVFTILDGGNVGIGTTAPTEKLDVEGSIRVGNTLKLQNASGGRIGFNRNPANGAIYDNTIPSAYQVQNNLGIFEIQSYNAAGTNIGNIYVRSGSLGIGTLPATKLHVGAGSGATVDTGYQLAVESAGIAGIQILAATNQSSRVVFGDSGDNDIGMLRYDHTDNSMRFITNGSGNERMRIASNGNVGIGTTSPDSILDLSSATPILTLNASTNNVAHGIEFKQSDTLDAYIKQTPSSGEFTFNVGRNATWGGDFKFTVDTYDTYLMGRNFHRFNILGSEVMRISDTSKVGIGTTSPAYKLHVQEGSLAIPSGSQLIAARFGSGVSNASSLEIKDVRTADGGDWTSAGKRIQMKIDTTHMSYIQFNGDNNNYGMSFGTGGTTTAPGNVSERMRITQGGNVGINTASPGYKLDVVGEGYFRSDNVSGSLIVAKAGNQDQKLFLRGGKGSGEGWVAAQYMLELRAGLGGSTSHDLWLSTAAGEALRVDAGNSNNIGIGTPVPNAKLHVLGGTIFGNSNTHLHQMTGSMLHIYNPTVSNAATTDLLKLQAFTGDFGADPAAIALAFKFQDGNNLTNEARIRMATVNDTDYGDNDEAASNLIFSTTNDGTESDKMIITGRGAIGIGTNNPGNYKLNIAGGNADQLLIENTTSSGTANIAFKANSTRNAGPFIKATARGATASDSDLQLGDETGTIMTLNGGNVGIGTTSPGHTLTVASTNDTTAVGIDIGSSASFNFAANSTSGYTTTFNMNNTGLDIGHDSTGRSLNLKTGAADRLTITGAGNVGIGTISPSKPLHVNGGTTNFVALFESTDTKGGINLADNTTSIDGVSVYAIGNEFGIRTGGVDDRIRINTAGNVGIGTTAPSQKLEVRDGNIIVSGSTPRVMFEHPSVSFQHDLLLRDNGSAGQLDYRFGGGTKIYFDQSSIRFGDWGAGTGTNANTQDPRITKEGFGALAGGLQFFTNNTARMSISGSTGYVGIGTASPSQRLHVVGNASVDGFVGNWSSQTRDKIRVWGDGAYTIGMKSGYTYGHLGNDYAMSFQMNSSTTRGFWWGTSGNSDAQGAMALTTDGRAVIATSLSIGEGTAVTSPSSETLYVDGDAVITGKVTAQEFHTEFVSASIIYQSGSTQFGDTSDDKHNFTGSVQVLGDLRVDQGITMNVNSGQGELGMLYDSQRLFLYGGSDRSTANGAYIQLDGNNFGGTNLGGDLRLFTGNENTADMYFSTAATTRMFISSSGNVGIGTTSPEGLLHISSTTAGDAILIIESDTDNNNENDNPQLQFKQDGGLTVAKVGLTGDAGTIFTDSLANAAYLGNDGGAPLQLYTNAIARLTVLNTTGNVGIGTTSPDYKLDVEGSIGVNDYIYHNGDTDTYFGFNAADSFKVRTGGGDRLVVPNNGAYVNGQFAQGVTIANKVFNYGAEFRTSGASIQIVMGRDTNGVGSGGIGADENSIFSAWNIDSGASEKFRIGKTGTLHASYYGSGNVTGTAAYNLQVDSSGNIIESAIGGTVANATSASHAEYADNAGTVGGISPGNFLRSDQADTANGNITFVNGTTLSGTQASTTGEYAILQKFLANPASEAGAQEDVRILNNLAGAHKWATITLTDCYQSDRTTPITTLGAAAFDGTSAHQQIYQNAAGDPIVIQIDLPYTINFSAWVGIVFGNPSWRTKSVKIETFRNGAWQTECNLTNQSSHIVSRQVAGNDSNGVSKIRYTLDDLQNTSNHYIRIVSLFNFHYRTGAESYGGVHYIDKYKDAIHYGHIRPATDSTYDLGSTSLWYRGIYGDKIYLNALDNNTSSTTALVLNGTEVEKRTLATGAFTTVGNSATQNTGSMTVLAADTAGSATTATSASYATNADTLDGVQGSSYLRSDAADTATQLTVNTLIVGSAAKIQFANNDFIRYDDANGVGRFHFDADGGTSNASVQASTFVGALSGNASTATTASYASSVNYSDVIGTPTLGNAASQNTGSMTVLSADNADTAGTATNANNINVDEKNDNVNYQVLFSVANGAGYQRPYIDTDNAHLTYNPSTHTLTAGTFSGALSGNASTATTATTASYIAGGNVVGAVGSATNATNATNFNVAADNTTNADHYLIFTGGATGNQRPNSDTGLTYNPGTNILTVGILEAGEKSFNIPHPTKEGKRLIYGVLEGPEHGVYVRGKSTSKVIELPEVWTGLVHEDSITVQLTCKGKPFQIWVEDIRDNKVFVETDAEEFEFFYYVQGERKDVNKLIIERDAD